MKKAYIRYYEAQDFDNPREWDNLGTMLCWNRRYSLGDKNPYISKYNNGVELFWEEYIEFNDKDRFKKENINKERVLSLPLYLYDHSGITMNTTGFSCGWDSGQVGFIYATVDKILKEYNRKHLSKKLIEKVLEVLKDEVKVYDAYIRGDMKELILEDEDGEIEYLQYYGESIKTIKKDIPEGYTYIEED